MLKQLTTSLLLGNSILLLAAGATIGTPEWEQNHLKELKETQNRVTERILKDIDTVEMAMGELPLPSDEKKPVFDELKQVTKYAKKASYPTKLAGFRTIIPLNKEHAKVFKAWSMILRDKGLKGLHVWHIDRFENFGLFDTPNREPVSAISLKMMRNERRSQAINLTNCSAQPQTIKITLTNIPSTMKIRLFHTVFVDTKKLKAVPSALLPLTPHGGDWSFSLPSGLTSQVWFMVDSDKVKAGNYSIPVKIEADKTAKELALKLDIAPVTFPTRAQMTHNLGMFDYATVGARGISKYLSDADKKAVIKAAINDLDDHLISLFHLGLRSLRLPSYDRKNFNDKGDLITKPDITNFKTGIAMLPKSTRYYSFAMALEREDGNYIFAEFPAGSKEGEHAFIQWLKYLDNTCKELNVDPKKIVIMLYDEPRSNDALKAAHDGYKIIKENSIFRTFCTVGARGAKNPYCEKVIKYVDIVNPCRRHVGELYGKKKKMFTNIPKQQGDKQLWVYDCGYKSSPLFYLKGAWQDARWATTGTEYWSYCDTGDNPGNWNMYPQYRMNRKRDNYSPVYLDRSGITITREWEAIREGVENCEYMHILRKKNPKSPLLKSKVPKTVEQSEALRLKILNALAK